MHNMPMSAASLHKNVVAFLKNSGNGELADVIDVSIFETTKAVQYQGSQRIGLFVCCRCPQRLMAIFEVIDDLFGFGPTRSPQYDQLANAINSVLPAGYSVHELDIKVKLIEHAAHSNKELLLLIDSVKNLMTAVSTGGPRIQEKNNDYKALKSDIAERLSTMNLVDPNTFPDLWAWYGRWSDGSMPKYQDRRDFIGKLYQPLIDTLMEEGGAPATAPDDEPTGWERVDRVWVKIKTRMRSAHNEEDFQAIGHQCREIMINVAQIVYDPNKHPSSDGIQPSKTDAKRMIDSYINFNLSGLSNEELRRHAKTTCDLANALQHRRSADKKDALVCMEATRTVINLLQILETT